MTKVILASGSPRRKELLEQIGVSFVIEAAKGEEIISKTVPSQVVEELSYQKAAEVAAKHELDGNMTVVIGADTIVAFDDQILGKPKDEEDAKRVLKMLQNHTHQVYTGVTVFILGDETKHITFFEKTDVTMYPMTDAQIAAYVATREPMDKAGSYAIQGKCAPHIQGISGDYNNVVGLPVARLMQEIWKLGIDIIG